MGAGGLVASPVGLAVGGWVGAAVLGVDTGVGVGVAPGVQDTSTVTAKMTHNGPNSIFLIVTS